MWATLSAVVLILGLFGMTCADDLDGFSKYALMIAGFGGMAAGLVGVGRWISRPSQVGRSPRVRR